MQPKLKKTIFYVVPVLFLLIGFWTCFSPTIWVDEAFSLELIKHPFVELIKLDAMDVHPPLYYLIYKVAAMPILIGGGGTEALILIGKIVSLVPYILLIWMGFTTIKREYGINAAFLFTITISGMPCMLTYATEIRMYSWALLFVTCAFLQAMKLVKESSRKSFVLLAIFSALAAYTHYFACVSAIIIYAELLLLFSINKKWKEFINTLLSGVGVAVAYVPWLIVFVTQLEKVSESYWIDAVSLRGIVQQVLFLFREKAVTPVILVVVFIGGVYALNAFVKGRVEPVLGIGIWLGTIFIGNVLSLLIRPIFVARYEMASAGCLWLAMAISLSAIDKQTLRKGVALVLVAVCFFVDLRYARADYITNKKTQMTVATLEQYMQDDTIIMSDSNHIQRVAAMRFPENESVAVGKELTELTQAVYSDLKLARCDEDAVGEYKGKKLLILEQDGELHTALAENGIETSYIGKYSMERYTFDLYVVNE